MTRKASSSQKSKRLEKLKLLTILIPACSILILTATVLFFEPTVTGLVIYDPNAEKLEEINAKVSLRTIDGEVIPKNAVVEVWIDDKSASMSMEEFIKRSGKKYKTTYGELPEFGFSGEGFTGDSTYKINLDEFDLDRTVGAGEHIFRTRLLYNNYVLLEKQNRIMIGGRQNARIN